MTGYNTASAPSPMSRALPTTDATGASYFLHDANKNVMQRTDAEGNLLEKYEYAPFGGNTGEARASIGFSSEAFDAATDLDYYNYRYYAPGLGRWTKRDPIYEIEGLLLYGMLMNNPQNYYDINGLSTFRWYGQWGGPGWAMGRKVKDGWSDPNNPNYQHPSSNTNERDYKDALDACYKEHDYCYERCRSST